MCNACGFLCCASDEFSGCGCDSCGEPECAAECDPINNMHAEDCRCPADDFDPNEFGYPDADNQTA